MGACVGRVLSLVSCLRALLDKASDAVGAVVPGGRRLDAALASKLREASPSATTAGPSRRYVPEPPVQRTEDLYLLCRLHTTLLHSESSCDVARRYVQQQ